MIKEKTIAGLTNFFRTLDETLTFEHRKMAMNTIIGTQIIDTVCPVDTKKWETGVARNGEWIIVEQYNDEKEALEGHTKWVQLIKKNPDVKLKDIDLWGLKK